MKSKRLLALVMSLTMIVLLFAGCGKTEAPAAQPAAEPAAAAPAAEGPAAIDYDTYYNISILTASTTGSYYPIGCRMAEMFPRYDANLYATAQSTGGGAENIKLVAAGDAEIGMCNQINFALADQGLQAFEGAPIDTKTNLRLLLVMDGPTHVATDAVEFLVPANSDIQTIHDFAGKNVSIGPAGSSCNNYVNMILESAGVDTADFKTIQYLSYDEQLSAMSDGLIDVACYYSGTPTAGVEQLGATLAVRHIPVDEEIVKKCHDDWGFTSYTLEPGLYSFLTEPVLCIQCARHSVFVRADMDESLAYRITKIILDNAETDLWDTGTYFNGVTKDNLSYGWSTIYVHPGAIRYYEENGITVPEGCYPPDYQH